MFGLCGDVHSRPRLIGLEWQPALSIPRRFMQIPNRNWAFTAPSKSFASKVGQEIRVCKLTCARARLNLNFKMEIPV
jgi:hypothetical protein